MLKVGLRLAGEWLIYQPFHLRKNENVPVPFAERPEIR
jgi:hypothetical protein